MKAYVFFIAEDPGNWEIDGIDTVYLDREKALDFWIELACYPDTSDPEEIYEAKEAFEIAEKNGEAVELNQVCMQVKEITQ